MTQPNTDMDNLVRRHDMALSVSDHHYIVLSFLHDWMANRALPTASGTLLDYGSGGQPYRALFETKVERYLAADVNPTPGQTLDLTLTPGQPVPLGDASVDTILSSQTLEHVPAPDFYMRECYRLLKPGGRLILTAPMQWRHHETPHDYYRFTRYGLRHVLESAGFAVEEITGTGGVYALIGQILLNTLSERGHVWPRIFRFINRTALWLDRRYPDGEDTINWMCLAHKP
jgi:SAM-dependent methyltransferase